jgi:hypothetical protein
MLCTFPNVLQGPVPFTYHILQVPITNPKYWVLYLVSIISYSVLYPIPIVLNI